MRAFAIVLCAVLAGCGGSGPTQAEGPKPQNLDSPPPSKSSGIDVSEAHAALEAKDYEKARKIAEDALAKEPNHAEAHFVVGVCDEADKKIDLAMGHYRSALKSDPKLLGASINLSALLIDQKQYDEAAEVARAGIKNAKGSAELHINLAYALLGKGEKDAAAKSFENAMKLRPDDAELRLWYADALLEAGDKAGASKGYKNAIAKAKGNAQLITAAAIGLAKADDPTGCVAALDQVISSKATPDSYTERAICKHKGKDLPGARKDLDDSIKLQSTVKAHFIAGKYAEEAGDKKACKLHFDEVGKMAAGTKVAEEAKKFQTAKCP
jgi:uncharacterized protein (TIGR02996 family)